jgi:2',3'-cyclic-nucleotide 2'-phosphodiesterase (5'-nucleotidase family)
MPLKFLYSILLVSLFISCRTRPPQGDDGKINLTLVQMNDVYEIAPLEGGKSGGMARVATLKKQAQLKNSNTLLLMAGDFISPSVYGSLTFEGKSIRGRQMIDAMNAAGFDMVCFGNHEFDIPEKDLQDRIDESKFTWISANAFHKVNNTVVPFHKNTTRENFPKYYFKAISDADGTTARVGFISVVLPSNPAEYVSYTDPVNAAIETYNFIKDSCDAIVALTHMVIKDDKRLAEALPGLAAILGGHEHDMKFEKENGVYITKAHANAKSAYVVNLAINKKRKKTKIQTKLVYLNEDVPLDSITNLTVQKWVKIANDNYASSGFDATAIVPYNGDSLDGRESLTRSTSTNLTKLITDAMLFAAPQAEAAIFNSGSIRVDDVLYPPITQYDILRTLPFGGGVRELEIKGDLLLNVLEAGDSNHGSGGWLQFGNIQRDKKYGWTINSKAIDRNRTYRIIVPDFLITGKETNLSFFNEQNPGVVKMYPAITTVGHPQSDIRLAIIKYLEQKK